MNAAEFKNRTKALELRKLVEAWDGSYPSAADLKKARLRAEVQAQKEVSKRMTTARER